MHPCRKIGERHLPDYISNLRRVRIFFSVHGGVQRVGLGAKEVHGECTNKSKSLYNDYVSVVTRQIPTVRNRSERFDKDAR